MSVVKNIGKKLVEFVKKILAKIREFIRNIISYFKKSNDAVERMEQAKAQHAEAAKRILIKGAAEVSPEAAKAFAAAEILLLGNESQTVGPHDAPMAVHQTLLE